MTAFQHFSTDLVPPGSRLGYWNDCAAATFSGMTIDSVAPTFRAEMSCWRVGDIVMARPHSHRSLVQRALDANDDERLIVHLQRRGRSEQRQRNIVSLLRPGDVSVCTTSSPLAMHAEDHELLVVQCPREPLQRRLSHLDDHLCALVSGQAPGARLLHDFVLALWREGEAGEEAVWEQGIAEILYDLIATALRCQHAAVTSDERRDIARLKSLVDARLCDPRLNGTILAGELGVSVRWVQHLFAGLGTTPGSYILNRRLDRAAERLAAEGPLSITALAFDLGFNDSAYFGRCFRARLGVTPTAFRRAGGSSASL